jgi:hypothetical protein
MRSNEKYPDQYRGDDYGNNFQMHGAQTKKRTAAIRFATAARGPPAMNPPLRMRSCIHNGHTANETFPERGRDSRMQRLRAVEPNSRSNESEPHGETTR